MDPRPRCLHMSSRSLFRIASRSCRPRLKAFRKIRSFLPQAFPGLCYGQWFSPCKSVYLLGAREGSGSFRMDNVRFERLTVR